MMGRQSLLGFVAVGVLCFCVSGCNTDTENPQKEGSFATSSTVTSAIAASGSTFVNPIMTNWIAAYQKIHPNIQITYRSIGSGGGIQEFGKKMVEFAASDAPLDDDKIGELFPLIQVPVTAGPVCVIYNLPGVKSPIRLSPNALAGIYLGKIETWRDPAIARDNPGANLPSLPVIVVHRVDGSGTTNIFTSYLTKTSPEWSRKAGSGLIVTWPVGLSGDGSKRMMDLVKQKPGAIGYAELSYANQNGLPVASIENSAGTYVVPSPESTTAAVDAFAEELAKDSRAPIVDPPASAKTAYPISGMSFALIPKDRQDGAEQKAVKDFIAYTITGGQDAAEGLFYAKLPASLQKQDQVLLNQLTAGGKPLN